MFLQVRLAGMDRILFLLLQCVECVHVCSEPSIILRLLPERALSAVVMSSMTGLPWAFIPYFAFKATLSLPVGWWEMQGRAGVCGLFWTEFLCKAVFCGEGLNLAHRGPFQVCGQICLH